MENDVVTPNTPNTGTDGQPAENAQPKGEADVSKEMEELREQNRQLFARAKKAEGFSLKDGEWVKEEKEKPKSTKKSDEKSDFDYGQKAYLIANGIKADEINYVKEVMEATGKDLDSVLASKYFQAELKERREAQVAEAAMPSGTKRSGTASRDSVEYWVAKGELPPNTPENFKLRAEVVNAKIKSQTSNRQFYNQ
jgi:hypothetical protein